ncbi:MAG TPA: hypothetical protein VF818_03045, partial [Ktedonobacterales bacterium]
NPTLADLVGGIGSVTLGDEEARRRGTQKTVLERKAPPTFDVLVEQEERHLVGIHHDVAAAVDDLLRGEAPQREMRERQPDGSIRRWTDRAPRAARADGVGLPTREYPSAREAQFAGPRRGDTPLAGASLRSPWWERRQQRSADDVQTRSGGGRWLDSDLARGAALQDTPATADHPDDEARPLPADAAATARAFRKRRIYPMGVNRNNLEQAIRELGLPAVITKDEREMDAVLVVKSLYRRQTDQVSAFQAKGIPVYVLRTSGVDHLREVLADLYRGDLDRARAAADAGSTDPLTPTP